ncbi:MULTISPECIES: RAMP superfamily CRISPR-associated protein [Spirulina sp. CCY15215]|uniref:RAMP superfamily CRISPR-associated protein n=1 Tax=Spirulina sp. CCY15215 TaxID=2767591 RepID=UPI00194FE16D|nr:RAMP superfamily CRISPR-associated protein [Spirulina major]
MVQMKPSSNQRIKRKQREIIRRIIVRGLLTLKSPTCLGSGDADSPTDMPLLRDSISQKALLTGASIAGALRNYLREYEHSYGKKEFKNDLAATLFGATRQDDDGDQSPLIIYNSISSAIPVLELRDGVRINSKTGTADDKAKYDLELLAAGTEFPIQFELLIDKQANANDLLKGLAIALSGLEKSEISLGMKKQRGFGRCQVKEWQVFNFDLTDLVQCREWLEFDHWTQGFLSEPPEKQTSIVRALGVSLDDIEDKRDRLTLEAIFKLEGSLLIRSGQAKIERAPDVVHLKSNRNGEEIPVISGTSLAGVLRHRSERIINTLKVSNDSELTLIGDLFGDVDENQKTAKASRIIVQEAEIKGAENLVQNRIAIDRFTGGAYHGALFDEQPIWGNDKTSLTINLEIRKPSNSEIGLLLLLLKDLWTGDLPIGGESSIGRGRLKGHQAAIAHCKSEGKKEWTISEIDGQLQVSNADELEAFVQTLVNQISGGETA